MRYASILLKAYAIALWQWHPRLAAAAWLAGLAVDVWPEARAGGGWRQWLGRLLLWQVAALAMGAAAWWVCGTAAMRWKDGIPLFAWAVSHGLNALGCSATSAGGSVCLTTMAGPLEFTISIDFMALSMPVLVLVLCKTWFGCAGSPLALGAKRLGWLAAILLLLALVRAGGWVLLANALFDFVGYESEELPWRPFMDPLGGVLSWLPFLLAVWVPCGRLLPAIPTPAPGWLPAFLAPRWRRAAVAGAAAALGIATCTEPAGTPKSGRWVISTGHAQWSTCKRPYDREWYGADSGYNYACMRRLLETFHEVAEAPGALTAADLDGAAGLVIYDPDRRFSGDEIALVREFVRAGGGLLVIGDHTNVFGSTSHLNELCEAFGFQFRDDVLFDLDDDFHQMIDRPLNAGAFWHGTDFFKLRGPASIRPTSLWTRPVWQVGHAKSVRAIYSVNNFYPPPHDNPAMRTGTFCVSAASRYGRGRVVAWGDSTVFSNFEIFYPGKYEYLLNAVGWLNHRDGMVPVVLRRMAPLVLVLLAAGLVVCHRHPRLWLAVALGVVGSLGLGALCNGMLERARTEFPKPVKPSEWVFFAAEAEDPGHHLRAFITEEPYDQRDEVFIQWVLRTGAFSGFHLLDAGARNGLSRHLRACGKAATANALIVRKPADLSQVGMLAAQTPDANDPLLLLFASTVPADQALAAVRKAGWLRSEEAGARFASAWPSSDAELREGERRILVVAGAERFSDQAMGISEKVVPDAAQRARFNEAFGLIDRVFGRTPPPPAATPPAAPVPPADPTPPALPVPPIGSTPAAVPLAPAPPGP